MNFSLSSLFAGFIFGTFGIYGIREGRRTGDMRKALIGLTMILYSYFVPNEWAVWGIGAALMFLLFRLR